MPTPWKGDRGPGCIDRWGGRLGTPTGGVLWWRSGDAGGSAIDTIAVWEVPYAVEDDIRPRFEEYVADTRPAFDAGRDEKILELFMRMTGASDDNIAARKAAGKQTAHWADSGRPRAHAGPASLFLNRYQLPADRLATVAQPRSWSPPEGRSQSPTWRACPRTSSTAQPTGLQTSYPAPAGDPQGPDHVVDPQIVGPLLLRFFSSEH